MTNANNKRIASNSLFLTLRSLITLVVSLYTSRIILDVLGVTDYGVFNVVGDVIEILSAPQRTVESLNKLSNIFREAAKEKDSTEQITEKINEQVPELSLITRYIPKNATELVAWLTFILIAMQTINQFSKDDSPDINIILNQSVEQSMEPQNYYPFNQQAIPPTRNSPCSCGSKKRYKHCCGLSI